jgi:hypothetical protein
MSDEQQTDRTPGIGSPRTPIEFSWLDVQDGHDLRRLLQSWQEINAINPEQANKMEATLPPLQLPPRPDQSTLDTNEDRTPGIGAPRTPIGFDWLSEDAKHHALRVIEGWVEQKVISSVDAEKLEQTIPPLDIQTKKPTSIV